MKAVQNNVRRTGQIVRFVMRSNSCSGPGGQLVREREDRHVNVNDDLYHAPHCCMLARSGQAGDDMIQWWDHRASPESDHNDDILTERKYFD